MCVETQYLLHWKQDRHLLAGGRWPVRQTVEQKSCVEPFLWNAVWPFSRTYKHSGNSTLGNEKLLSAKRAISKASHMDSFPDFPH